jgi:hypothetical protein
MKFILNIYIKDNRTTSGRRLTGSYVYERKNQEAMDREVKELGNLYSEESGYTMEVIAADEA